VVVGRQKEGPKGLRRTKREGERERGRGGETWNLKERGRKGGKKEGGEGGEGPGRGGRDSVTRREPEEGTERSSILVPS
jgi:hypothetical protein